ncbi:hypothetical protein L1987_09300 [Smallanthus sonchifolius]|uniref:Uncharacterized protein n=1 Tax=Smallanthus sonchifolius TaxID=185202 RepID=A0ACB9JP03_9ASTR|nr:hypothetical protein L1987_09300 [Smallanthus sonchifolius]
MAIIHKSLPFTWPVVASSASSLAESASASATISASWVYSSSDVMLMIHSCTVVVYPVRSLKNYGAAAQAHLRVTSGRSLSRSSNPNMTHRLRLLGSPYCQLGAQVTRCSRPVCTSEV